MASVCHAGMVAHIKYKGCVIGSLVSCSAVLFCDLSISLVMLRVKFLDS